MAKKETILISLQIDQEGAKKQIADNTTALRGLSNQRKELQKQLKDAKITEEQYTTALLQNQQAAKSLTQQNKQLDLSMKASENSVEGLRARIAALTAESNKMDLNSEEFTKAQEELDKLNDTLIEIGKDRSDFRANVGNYGSAVQGFEDHIESLKSKLNTLDLHSEEFKKTRAEIDETTQALGRLQTGVGGIEGKLNEFGNKLSGINSSFSNLGTSIKGVFGTAAVIGGVVALTTAVVKLKNELDKAREQVATLTGAQGNTLDRLTAKVTATASTWDKDLNEVLITSNTVAKQFGLSATEATDLIQKGFVNGADATGNFLADLTEFAPQFDNLGLSASEAIAIMSQQPESGVFSNKGIDALKNAGTILQQMPDNAKAAIDAIGLSGKELQKQIQDGTITSFQAVQQISAQLSKLPENSKAASEAISTIFGGAGEDAGRAYLETLKDVETDLDKLTESADDFAKANLQIVEAQERINLLFNQILGSGGNTFRSLKGAALEFVADALDVTINGIIDTINYFRQLYNESIIFRAGVQYIKVTFQNLWAAIKVIFNQMVDSLQSIGKILRATFTGNFDEIPGLVADAFKTVADNATGFGKEVYENFSAGWQEIVDPAEFLEPLSLGDAEAYFYNAGAAAGDAFNEGVKITREQYLKDLRAFLQTQLLLVSKNTQAELDLKLRLIEVERDLLLIDESLTANERLLIQTQANVDQQQATKDHYLALKEIERKALEEALLLLQEYEQRQTLELKLQFLNREINEQEFHDNLFEIREQAILNEIDQYEEGTLARLQKEVELEELRQTQVAEAKAKELETNNLIRETTVGNDSARLQSAQALADGIAQIATETTTAGRIAAGLAKGIAIADIIFNLQQELAANAAAGAKIAAQGAPYTIPAGTAYTTTRNILAGVRSGVSIAKIVSQTFDKGGVAGGDNMAFSGGHMPRLGGMIQGLSHREGGVKFNMGNRVGEADGRKGEAYIVNTHHDPKLKAMASAINVAGGGKSFFNYGGVATFANGGTTSGVNSGSLLPPPQTDFQAILENLPTPVVLVDDIVNGTNQKLQVEQGAIL
jgi:phage-related minor tail protein